MTVSRFLVVGNGLIFSKLYMAIQSEVIIKENSEI